ncbi:22929_t:CDS:2, partial [Dentiscutata erythropus]
MRKRVVDMVNNKYLSITQVSQCLRLASSMVKSIVNRFDEEDQIVLKPRGGDRRSKLNSEHRIFLKTQMEINPSIMINELHQNLLERFSDLQQRINLYHDIIYIDESGFNLHLLHSRERAPREQRAIKEVPKQHGKNITIIAAIDGNGIVK